MQKFTKLTALAAPLPIQNVDTDMIIPKQFLTTIKRTGLKDGLFYEMRFDMQGKIIPEFVLNREEYKKSEVLVSGENFGCGSSREHAPWALLDFGIRSVIAPSFADIFYNNCFKNGILPVVLPKAAVEELMEWAKNPENTITVDLATQQVRAANKEYKFEVDPFRKECLMNGLDDIGLTMEKVSNIDSFESKNSQSLPWLYS